VLNQLEVIRGLEKRLNEIIPIVKPNVLHAHSPCLNAIAALRAGRKFGIPVVYEVRAFWEDAAVDHGTSTENGLRYKLTRGLETYALKRADAVTTICEGLRGDIVARGIPASKVTVIPNAVDIDKFAVGGVADMDLKRKLGFEHNRLIGFIG
ncbi:glycosyltransferase, partial [Acinetobacter baumannii]|uniref:glycosyltransferase n=1 Tax=Acinetobacter baumannii TaxID=470 RepID=UPI001898E823